MRVFPGVAQSVQDSTWSSSTRGAQPTRSTAAFFSREDAEAVQAFREHPGALRLEPADIRRLSPQTLTFFEFKGRRDLDIVRKAYRLHPPFGQGLMQKLGLKYRTEFHMGNMAFLFRDRAWLRRHGCTQEPGEKWRAADAAWYRSRDYVERPIAVWYAVFDGDTPVDYRVPWPIPRARLSAAPTSTTSRSDSTSLAASASTGKDPTTSGSATVFFPGDEDGPTDATHLRPRPGFPR